MLETTGNLAGKFFIFWGIIEARFLEAENFVLFNFSAIKQSLGIPTWVHRLGCKNDTYNQLFMIAEKYGDIKVFLQVLGLIISLMYFITSYDSAALVMGIISSNGKLTFD